MIKKIILMLTAVYVSTAVAFSISDTAEPGRWTKNIDEARAKADPSDQVHVPIVVFSANKGCGYCETLENALSTAAVQDWMEKRGYYFVFGTGSAVRSFVNMSGELPFIRVVWKRKTSTGNTYEISAKWHGRKGMMPVKEGSLAEQFMDSVDKYVGTYAPDGVRYVTVTPVAVPAAGGKVSGGGLVLEGESVTVKATVKSGYTFGGWYSDEGVLLSDDSTYKYVSPDVDSTVTARFYKRETDFVTVACGLADRYERNGENVTVPIEISSFSRVTTVKATGLPPGLRLDSSKRVISGVPTKSGVYQVTVSAKNESGNAGSTAKMRVLVMSATEHYLEVTCPEGMGKVAGSCVRAAGDKVTVKASAAADWIFSHWEEDGKTISSAASFTYRMPDQDARLTAFFISKADDRDSIALTVAGTAQDVGLPSERETMCGVKVNWPIVPSALSATSVSVSGLPAGLKLVKTVVDKDAKINAYAIGGVPTSVSKVNSRTDEVTPSKVKIKVTTAGRNSKIFQMNVRVTALPVWAYGSFSGTAYDDGEPVGRVTLTVAASGKISSGKLSILTSSSSFSLSGSGFEEMAVAEDVTNFTQQVAVKAKGSFGLSFAEDAGVGIVDGTGESGLRLSLVQNVWSRKDLVSGIPAFGTGSRQPTLALDDGRRFKFKAKGAVAIGGKLEGVSVSGSSQLEMDDLMTVDGHLAMRAHFPAYIAPKRGFAGNCDIVSVLLSDRDGDGKLEQAEVEKE